VRVNMDLANVHMMQIVYGKSWLTGTPARLSLRRRLDQREAR
jgi:hypothetical protein